MIRGRTTSCSVQAGRFFQDLTSYDLLGNLVPGVALLTALSLFLPQPWLPSTAGGSALFVVCSYVLGGIVQTHASASTGSRTGFERSIRAGRGHLGHLDILDRPQENETTGRDNGLGFAQVCRLAFLSPVSFRGRAEQSPAVDDPVLTSKIRDHLYNRYGVEPDSGQVDVLYRLMLSEVGDGGGSTAVRMRALRNLYRGMWITLWYVSVLLIVSIIIKHSLNDCAYLPLALRVPSYYDHWGDLWQVLPPAAGTALVLRYITEARDRKFVEYLFTDYAARVSLPQDDDSGVRETARGYD